MVWLFLSTLLFSTQSFHLIWSLKLSIRHRKWLSLKTELSLSFTLRLSLRTFKIIIFQIKTKKNHLQCRSLSTADPTLLNSVYIYIVGPEGFQVVPSMTAYLLTFLPSNQSGTRLFSLAAPGIFKLSTPTFAPLSLSDRLLLSDGGCAAHDCDFSELRKTLKLRWRGKEGWAATTRLKQEAPSPVWHVVARPSLFWHPVRGGAVAAQRVLFERDVDGVKQAAGMRRCQRVFVEAIPSMEWEEGRRTLFSHFE